MCILLAVKITAQNPHHKGCTVWKVKVNDSLKKSFIPHSLSFFQGHAAKCPTYCFSGRGNGETDGK